MSPLATTLATTLEGEAKQFHDLVDAHENVSWRDFLRAWGELREADVLMRDDSGRYYIGDGKGDG